MNQIKRKNNLMKNRKEGRKKQSSKKKKSSPEYNLKWKGMERTDPLGPSHDDLEERPSAGPLLKEISMINYLQIIME